MRVAYVCADPGIPVFGHKGCSVHVQEVIRAMVQLGATVDLFATRIGGDPPDGLEVVAVHPLPSATKGTDRAAREQFALGANDALGQALDANGPFDLVYERYSIWSHAGMQWAKDGPVPGVLEVNAPLIEEQASYRGLTDRDSARRVAQSAFGAATALVAVSSGVADYLRSFEVPRDRIAVIPNAVNPDRFNRPVTRNEDAPDQAFTVGFLGTLKAWHGIETLIEAFDVLCGREISGDHQPRLLVVGDGPQRESLTADVANRGLSGRVEWAGSVSPDEVPAWLNRMDVGVAPYSEAANFYFSPLKVLEYMAAGLPVVASRVGQLETLIEHGISGLLCRPGDPIALADALEQLQCSRPLIRHLGHAGRQFVFKNHTWQANVKQVFDLTGLTPSLELCA